MQDYTRAIELGDFNDKRILVTGGTRGIGAAMVDRFQRGGGKVITAGRSLPSDGSSEQFVGADLSTREGQYRDGSMRRVGHFASQRRRLRCTRWRRVSFVR